MSILLFFIVLAILVLTHEFGHFIVAKLSGIRVDEFGFGFPPKLFGYKKGETEYTLNLIPFGGFVRIFGEEENEEFVHADEKTKERSLYGKPRYIQAAVMAAGVTFNVLLAWFLISTSLFMGTPVAVSSLSDGLTASNINLTLTEILPNTPAEEAGLRVGDAIIYLNRNGVILTGKDLGVDSAIKFIAESAGSKLLVGYKRDGGEIAVASVVPVSGIVDGRAATGVSFDMVGTLKLSFLRSFMEGADLTIRLAYEMVVGLIDFFFGFFTGVSSLKNVAGPVGLAGIVGDASKLGLSHLMNIMALISINLAVLNIAPFPALDGGRLAVLLFEGATKRTLNPRITGTINTIGFLALISLMFVITYSDIVKIIFPT